MSSSAAAALDSVHRRGTLRLLGAAGAGARLRAPAQRTSAAVRGLPTCRRPPAPATQDRQTVSRPGSVQQHVKRLQEFFVTFLMVLHLTPSCQETCENMVYASTSQASAKDDKGLAWATAGVAERFPEADAHAPTQSKALCFDRAHDAHWHGCNKSNIGTDPHLHRRRHVPHRKLRRRVRGERRLPPLDGHRHDDLRTPEQEVHQSCEVCYQNDGMPVLKDGGRHRGALRCSNAAPGVRGHASLLTAACAVLWLKCYAILWNNRLLGGVARSYMAGIVPVRWRVPPRRGCHSTSPKAARQKSTHPARMKLLVQQTGSETLAPI